MGYVFLINAEVFYAQALKSSPRKEVSVQQGDGPEEQGRLSCGGYKG